jgi:membrane associated rhomboid family serine protease
MIALYFFGRYVEQVFNVIFGTAGLYIFAVLYISAIVISEIPSYIINYTNSYYRSLGASGAVSALIFISILYNPSGTIYVYFIPLPSILAGALFILYSVQMSKSLDGVNHFAHLSGSIYGLIFAVVSNPDVVFIFLDKLRDFKLF